METPEAVAASFRDPSGFIYRHENKFRRAIAPAYRSNYERLNSSGLYADLTSRGLLIPHHEIAVPPALDAQACIALEPEQLVFESYPYEWCFSALKDAALTTLEIQTLSMARGMNLKDASAYNIQFLNGRPTLIDTLSFEEYIEGTPWVAYRQFCQHFLAPLLLMARTDVSLNALLRIHLDGIPLPLTSKLLPRTTWLSLSSLAHIHLHGRHQQKLASAGAPRTARVSRTGLLGILENLKAAIRRLHIVPAGTEWADYYKHTNYSEGSFELKRQITDRFIEQIRPTSVWDLGANEGVFSRLASERQIPTLSFDIDPSAVEKNYLRMRKEKETCILPLLLDLTNPSPSIGWANRERKSLEDRGPADLVLALALVHHLAISNNLPLARIASYFQRISRNLVIEFVPKTDSQVARLLATRPDIFPEYHIDGFRAAFRDRFEIIEEVAVPATERTLFLMRTR